MLTEENKEIKKIEKKSLTSKTYTSFGENKSRFVGK